MTNEETQSNSLQNWWDNFDFEGKNYCELKETGELVLKATPNYPERNLATLHIEIADAAIKALLEKFPEVEKRVKDTLDEWETIDDKLKLVSKVTRLKDYIVHTNAIGNFSKLIEQISEIEKEMTQLIEQNYVTKLALIETAENTASTSIIWKEGSQKLKEFSEIWKTLGYVDKQRNEDLWNRLENAKNNFFERKRNFQDEQEKELLRNLDRKMEIVEKAEASANSENWKESTELFKSLMDQWRSIGRITNDRNEELWGRFILAKNNFFQRKREHFEVIQQEQEQNYTKKLELVEKAESIKDSTDWIKTSQVFAEILDGWKSTGKVPMDKTEELWNRMNTAKDFFFNNKRGHLETQKVEHEDNYAQKLALLKRAESIKNSSNWKETTDEMNELLAEWKKIGMVPRAYIHTLWDQFLEARKHFFNRKDEYREKRRVIVEKQITTKHEKTKSFLEQLEQEHEDEKERLSEFRTALENVTPGNKAAELRSHLEKLIVQSEHKIKQRTEKIDDIRTQLKDIEKINNSGQKEKRKSNKKTSESDTETNPSEEG
jgi:hypothetical protein